MKTGNAKSQLISIFTKARSKISSSLRVAAESHRASYWYNLRVQESVGLKVLSVATMLKAWLQLGPPWRPGEDIRTGACAEERPAPGAGGPPRRGLKGPPPRMPPAESGALLPTLPVAQTVKVFYSWQG